MIEFTIKTLDGKNHAFSVEPDISVAQLKDIITERLQMQPADQRLIFQGRVLQDDIQLSDYKVDQKVIHLVQRPPPSQLRPPSDANPPVRRSRNFNLAQDGRAGAGLVFETFNLSTETENENSSRGTVLWVTIERLEHVRRILQDIRNTMDYLDLDARLFALGPSSSNAQAAAAAGPSSDYSGAEYFTTRNTNTESDSNLVTDGLPRAALLADVLEEVNVLQARLLPYYRQYIAHLRDHNTRAEAESVNEQQFYSNQVVAQRIRIIMHSLSHVFHTISDIQYEFDENRLTSGPMSPQQAIPIQAQINVVTSRPRQPPTAAGAEQPTPRPPAGQPGVPYRVQIETHVPIAIAVAERRTPPAAAQAPNQPQQTRNENQPAPTGATPATQTDTPNAGAVPRPRVSVMPFNLSDLGMGGSGQPIEMSIPDFAGVRTVGGGPAELPAGLTHELLQNILQTVLSRTPAAIQHLHSHVHAEGVEAAAVSQRDGNDITASESDEAQTAGPTLPRNIIQDLISANRSVRAEGRSTRHLGPQIQQNRSYDRFLACTSAFRDRNNTGRYPVDGQARTNSERLHMLNGLATALDQYRVIDYFDPTAPNRSEIVNDILSSLARELTLGDLIRLFLGNWIPLQRLYAPLNEILQRLTNGTSYDNERSERFREVATEIINVQNDFWPRLSAYIYPNPDEELNRTSANFTASLRTMMCQSLANMMDLVVTSPSSEAFSSFLYGLVVRSVHDICRMLYSHCAITSFGAEHAIRDYTHRMLSDFDPHYHSLLFTLMQSVLPAVRVLDPTRRRQEREPSENEESDQQDEPTDPGETSTMENRLDAELESLLSMEEDHLELVLDSSVSSEPEFMLLMPSGDTGGPETDGREEPSTTGHTDLPVQVTVSECSEPSQSSSTFSFHGSDHDNNAGTEQVPPENAADDVENTTDRPADWTLTAPAEWVPMLTEDERKQRNQAAQPPFSDAYLSGMPARKRKIVQQRKPESFEQMFEENLREANGQVQDVGTASDRAVPQCQSQAQQQQLVQAYCEAARQEAQARIAIDPDFTPERYPGIQRYFNQTEPNSKPEPDTPNQKPETE